jgi:hypothetical protein
MIGLCFKWHAGFNKEKSFYLNFKCMVITLMVSRLIANHDRNSVLFHLPINNFLIINNLHLIMCGDVHVVLLTIVESQSLANPSWHFDAHNSIALMVLLGCSHLHSDFSDKTC